MSEYRLKEYRAISKELKKFTRIERLARRLPVQIDFISRAIDETSELDGIILELGLGEGRTLEYLERNTSSPILVFEIDENAGLDNCRESTMLVKGDIFKTLPQIFKTQNSRVRMVHADLGSTDYLNDISRLEPIGTILDPIVAAGGVIVCDRPISFPSFELLANAHTSGWPYYLWKKRT